MNEPQKVVLVLSGGLALGAYQAGAYAALHEHGLRPEHLAGASIGAVNAALIAGGDPQGPVRRLREFWSDARVEPPGAPTDWLLGHAPPWRHARNWLSILRARALGSAAIFRPRIPAQVLGAESALYDLAPLQAKLEATVDFDHLNGGEVRVSVLATDIEAGLEVVFDTKNDRLGMEHLLASCGFLPEFPAVRIGGRLLGDGGLTANAPVEAVLPDDAGGRPILCFVVDLFSAAGPPPSTLEEAAARRIDLLLGAQTHQALRRLHREHRLRHAGKGSQVKVLHLRYRAAAHEAAPEKHFDFSPATLAERWEAGYLDMAEGIGLAAHTDGRDVQGERGVALSVWS